GTVVIGLVRDITERKQAGEELVILKQAVDTSGEAIFLTDRDGIITFLNPAFTELYGYTADEVVGKVTPRILKSGQMKPEDYELFWKTLLDRQIVTGELLNKNKNGVIRVIEGSANSVTDDKGNIIGFLAIQRDITEHKQAEDTLRESEERYRALLELSGEVGEAVVMLQDTDGKKAVHAFATGEWPRITGYSMEELLGMSWFELLQPDYRQAALERYQRRIDGEVILGLFELSIVRKDGAEVPVEITGGPTTYLWKSALVVYVRDITGPKKAEQEREKLIQELRETLQEVKTLSGLLPICAWCKKLRDDEGYWKSVEEYLSEHTGAKFTHGICPECAAEFSDRG
ncbi:MAG: PAS domain S-box protein, partial [Dehalococcoidales bacterium]